MIEVFECARALQVIQPDNVTPRNALDKNRLEEKRSDQKRKEFKECMKEARLATLTQPFFLSLDFRFARIWARRPF